VCKNPEKVGTEFVLNVPREVQHGTSTDKSAQKGDHIILISGCTNRWYLGMRVMNERKEQKDGGRRRWRWANLRHNTSNYMEVPKKGTKNLRKDSRCPCQNFNREHLTSEKRYS
jgi:hypothetical protein